MKRYDKINYLPGYTPPPLDKEGFLEEFVSPIEKEALSDGERTAEEILGDNIARRVLPYLMLDELSDEEKARILSLAEKTFDSVSEEIRSNRQQDVRERALVNDALDDLILKAVGEEAEQGEEPVITPKIAEARKLFCACLLEETNDESMSWKERNDIRNQFFGGFWSEGFSQNCGGVTDVLELLTIAQRTGDNPILGDLYEEIIVSSIFGSKKDENGFKEALTAAEPIKQLALLPVMRGIARCCAATKWNGPALEKISEALLEKEQDQATTPLVRVVISDIMQEIEQRQQSHAEAAMMDYRSLKERLQRPQDPDFLEEQKKLHQEFPSFSENQTLIRIAPGIAASTTSGTIDVLANRDGDSFSLLRYAEDGGLKIGEEMVDLLGAIHNPEVKKLINEKLGLDLTEVSLESQMQLLKFMTEANNQRFDQLCSALGGISDQKLRLKLAEAFLAVDFGEDFGDALLDIANSDKISSEQLAEILTEIDTCRSSIHNITELFYRGFNNGEFADQCARAANDRLTDALMVFREIAKNGVASADLGGIWGEVDFDYETAMEALKYESKSLGIVSGTLSDVVSGEKGAFAERFLKPDFYRRRSYYNFYSPRYGYVLLYTRSEGSATFDDRYEYGRHSNRYNKNSRNSGVEASISLLVNLHDPFSLPNPLKPDRRILANPSLYDHSTMDIVSALRIDREGRAPDAPANDPNREPTNEIGTASVDLASILHRRDTPGHKIARLISTGNKLRVGRTGGAFDLNHNTNWINQERYGTAEGFRRLVEHVDSVIGEWCKEASPPQEKGKSFTRLMKRKLGKKVLGAA